MTELVFSDKGFEELHGQKVFGFLREHKLSASVRRGGLAAKVVHF